MWGFPRGFNDRGMSPGPIDPRAAPGPVQVDLTRVLDEQHRDDDVDGTAGDPLTAARFVEIIVRHG